MTGLEDRRLGDCYYLVRAARGSKSLSSACCSYLGLNIFSMIGINIYFGSFHCSFRDRFQCFCVSCLCSMGVEDKIGVGTYHAATWVLIQICPYGPVLSNIWGWSQAIATDL